MRNVLKRRYKNICKDRREFKAELYKEMLNNKALTMLVIENYKAYKHHDHITKIWWLLRNYKDAQKDYNKNLFGKHLATNSYIWKSFRGAQYNYILKKYARKIPETIAMGDALTVAYKCLKANYVIVNITQSISMCLLFTISKSKNESVFHYTSNFNNSSKYTYDQIKKMNIPVFNCDVTLDNFKEFKHFAIKITELECLEYRPVLTYLKK